MSDAKQPESPSPQQRYDQETAQQDVVDGNVQTVHYVTDALNTIRTIMPFGLGGGTGRSDFEGAPLNAMLDFLDSANPADLEAAGDSLENVTTALNKAANQLDIFVGKTHWEGEGAEEFRRYGKQLTTYAYDLGDFANAAGAQMKVASTGLSSVRNSKPPRDGRLVQKKPDDFAVPERTQDNEDYQKALQVEKDRQEAINQMNRLASFYAVSESSLAAQQPPTPPQPLNVGVPKPTRVRTDGAGDSSVAAPASSGLSGASPAQFGTARTDVTASSDGTPRTEITDKAIDAPNGSGTRTEINSIAPPATPPVQTLPNGAPPITTGTTPPPGPIAPVGGGSLPQGTTGTAPKTTGAMGGRRPGVTPPAGGGGAKGATTGRVTGTTGRPIGAPSAGSNGSSSAAGRTGGTTGGHGAAGRAAGTTTGRPGIVGGTGQSSPVGRVGGSTGPGSAGRQGGGSFTGRAAQSGIVGGTPQQRSGAGSGGQRIPRGTVIGGGTAPTGRSTTSRPGSNGVVGVQQPGAGSRSTGRGTPSVNGVVGTPRGGAAAQPSGTTGGGPRGGRRGKRDEKQDRTESTRPEYLAEDEENWAARRRNAVPPVID
ncbi:hypothetical protein [Streptomyces sp. ODS05-4]|uniref:hypothetical protein n=1 Tax=Streptomyces sp. ODS05-4 TaxID=2944939 RepID=UPI002109F6F1|nr:hypothetical protein [Streptomyces sp. ODS05-4]